MIAVTGATGKLGRKVIDGLLNKLPAGGVVAAVRNPGKASDLAARGVQVRQADYTRPDTLDAAFAGIEKLLLISSNEVGQRAVQHKAVIESAVRAGVRLIAYTSLLRADRSGLSLAGEHMETEQAIRATGLPFVFLRNGWYMENYTENLGAALQHGAIVGSAGDGRVAAATRADYAAAAVAVLTSPGHEGRVYELAGDEAFTMPELAAAVSRVVGRTIGYTDLPPAQYKGVLLGAGLPEFVVDLYVDFDLGALRGDLNARSDDLRRLIGRPTTALDAAVAEALATR